MSRFFGLNFLTIRRSIHLSLGRCVSRPKIMENTAYFRYTDGEDNFHVTFQFTEPDLKISKQFNFCRKITENAGSFLSRVDANVAKIWDKKQTKKKAKNEQIASEEKIKTFLLRDNSAIDENFQCHQIFQSSGKYALLILGKTLPIEVNAPWIEAFSLPKGAMSGFLQYPSKFEAFFTKRELSKWTWSRSKDRGGPWTNISNEAQYTTTTADVGHYLRLSCKPVDENGRLGPELDAISPDAVAAGPGPMPCESRHKFTSSKTDHSTVRVVSYNILADLYVDSEYSKTVLFGYCPTYALELSYRRQLMIKELLGYNADIMCLQEVDLKVFKHDLIPVFKSVNMDGEFCQKGAVSEGTAVFYDRDKFRVDRSWRIQLSEAFDTNPLFEDLRLKVAQNEAFLIRIRNRSTTLQVLLLQTLAQPKKMILLANIHLYFHPDADHVRLFQAILCIKLLENLKQELQTEFPQKDIAVIWCGDFNSVPECGIYALLTTGIVPEDHIDWASNAAESPKGISHSHNMLLSSACGTPEYTNYTLLFKACLDYIFYSPNSFIVNQVVPLPSNDELALHSAIPSVVCPSDHVALVADLKWTNQS